MLLTTTEAIEGKELMTLGMVKGSTIQTVNAFKDIGAGFKTLVGGELKNYNKMMAEARDKADSRMIEEAEKLGQMQSSEFAMLLLRLCKARQRLWFTVQL